MKVRFFNNFENSQQIAFQYLHHETLKKQNPDYSYTLNPYCVTHQLIHQFGTTRYHDIEIVDDDSYTHAIIFSNDGKGLDSIKPLPRERILILPTEPTEMQPEYQTNHQMAVLQSAHVYSCETNYPFLFHLPLRSAYQKHSDFFKIQQRDKQFPMSIILSDKQFLKGHKYRHALVKRILKTNLEIHIFGRGCRLYKDDRVKGEFKNIEPYQKYHFTIVIENSRHAFYMSEKFTNAIACGCIPIYAGAYHADAIFGNTFYKLSGNLTNDIQFIETIFNNITQYLIDLSPAQYELFEGKAFLLKEIETLFKDN